MRILSQVISLFLITLSFASLAAEAPSKLTIENPWVRHLPGKMSTGAFMIIKNTNTLPVSVISASSDVANTVELHDHIKIDGMMKMSKVEKIEVPANGQAELKPGSLHVMLIDLKKELSPGQVVDIKLGFSNGTQIEVKAPVTKGPK